MSLRIQSTGIVLILKPIIRLRAKRTNLFMKIFEFTNICFPFKLTQQNIRVSLGIICLLITILGLTDTDILNSKDRQF